jgi:hypothetical protein
VFLRCGVAGSIMLMWCLKSHVLLLVPALFLCCCCIFTLPAVDGRVSHGYCITPLDVFEHFILQHILKLADAKNK